MKAEKTKYVYYNHGIKTKVQITSQETTKELENLITKLILDTDDMLRLLVSKERIDNLKKNESGLEISFNKRIVIHSEKMKDHEVDKIYIPFSGDFVGNEKSKVSTIFLADGPYISGPLRNSNGLDLVNQIEKLILNFDK